MGVRLFNGRYQNPLVQPSSSQQVSLPSSCRTRGIQRDAVVQGSSVELGPLLVDPDDAPDLMREQANHHQSGVDGNAPRSEPIQLRVVCRLSPSNAVIGHV